MAWMFFMKKPGEGVTVLTDDDLAKLHKQRLRQALDDSSLLTAFASESKRPTTAEMITSLIKAKTLYEKSKDLAETAETDFWNAYSSLTTAVQPATISGIKNGTINKDLGFLGWMLKYPWISLPAALALVLYIVLQIYTVRGAHILKQYDAASTQLTESKTDDSEKKLASTSTGAFVSSANAVVLEGNVRRYKLLLAEWNRCTFYTAYLHCPDLELSKVEIAAYGKVGADWETQGGAGAQPASAEADLNTDVTERATETVVAEVNEDAVRAQIRLNNLNSSILPMILGLLGACTQVLRSISRRVIDQSMNTIFLPAYYVRIVLGVITGAIIGLFLLPAPSATAENPFAFLSSLPLLTAAFLAGYAAEVFFALLDKVVGDARNYVTGTKPVPK